MYRHHPQTLRLKQLIDEGAVGQVRVIRGAFTFTLTRETDVRLDPLLGGGSLWDVGCYPISMARYLVGDEPSEVSGWQRITPSGVDETFAGQLDFGSTVAQFDCGFRGPLRTHLEIVGTEGSIVVPAPFKPGLEEQLILNRGGSVETVRIEGEALYTGELDDLADAAAGGRPRISLRDSRGTIACILALYESAQSGEPVALA